MPVVSVSNHGLAIRQIGVKFVDWHHGGMKAVELSKKSTDELRQLLGEKLLRMEELRTLLVQKKAKNVKELGLVRRDIARILTVLQQVNRPAAG